MTDQIYLLSAIFLKRNDFFIILTETLFPMIERCATKEDLETAIKPLVTKEDTKQFATKQDIKEIRDDMKHMFFLLQKEIRSIKTYIDDRIQQHEQTIHPNISLLSDKAI